MSVVEKYRLRQVDWSDEAELHVGPLDPAWKVPVAVKLRHGLGGPPRPDGRRDRFLRAAKEQAAAVVAGCQGIAPVFETGQEGNNAFYVTKHYVRSLAKLVEGRVRLTPAILHRVTDIVLRALEELRDKDGRSHGNLKLTNLFLDGRDVQDDPIVVGDLGLRDEASQAADCNQLGGILYQLVRAQFVEDFDWPIETSSDWERLGAQANAWRRFCNVLRSPDLGQQTAPLAEVRQAFKKMRARANDAPSLSGAGVRRPQTTDAGSPAKAAGGNRKGMLAGVGVGIVALVGAGVLYVNQTSQKLTDKLNETKGKAGALLTLSPALGGLNGGKLPLAPGRSSPSAAGQSAAGNSDAGDGGTNGTPTQAQAPGGVPTAAPGAVAESTPPPAPPTPTPDDSQSLEWTKYLALLDQFKGSMTSPAVVEDSSQLNTALEQLKERVQYLTVSSDQGVGDFVRSLPLKLEPSGDLPALPANLWTKVSAAKVGDMQTLTYQWNKGDIKMQFNRVALPGGNGPAAFYLSATTVPVRFGLLLAQAAGPLRAANFTGPVAWLNNAGRYTLRPAWITADPGVNGQFYRNTGAPVADSPMNGLAGPEALQLAQAAGCTLPTLRQWAATLSSPAGQLWQSQWRTTAKVRSPQWSQFAKNIVDQRVTGAILPNQQCFGNVGARDLNPVTTTADSGIFFEPVDKREAGGFYHLIGNVGQYVTDEGSPPAKYYFAGGSAVSAPDTFADLASPPAVTLVPIPVADAGFRLAVRAQGNGQATNKPLESLKKSLDSEIQRAETQLKASR